MIYFTIFLGILILMPAVRKLAFWLGVIDASNGDPLKIHMKAVPLLGGTAVLAAMGAGLVYIARIFPGSGPFVAAVSIGGCLVFGIGLLDDVKDVRPWVRLAVHVTAGLILVFAGFRVRTFSGIWISASLTVFFIAGAVNALNIIDGMDGLCAGVSLISSLGFAFYGAALGERNIVALALMLAMGLGAFLPYNLYPARMFLGDAGSGLIGFLLGTLALAALNKPHGLSGFFPPLFLLGVPVVEMAFAVLRRLIHRKPLFLGDREHAYDLLLKKGLSQPIVWGIMCVVQVLIAAAGLWMVVG